MAKRRYPHIFLKDPPAVKNFTTPQSGPFSIQFPPRERIAHSAFLEQQFNRAWQQSENERAVSHADRHGVYIEFVNDPDFPLTTRGLEDMKSKQIRLLNVRTNEIGEKTVTYATVFVANEKKSYFLKKIEQYSKEITKKEKFKNAKLIESISDIRKAILESFWQDDLSLLPSEQKEWCEVWLSSDSEAVTGAFEELLRKENIEAARGVLLFPERAVKLILVSRSQLEKLLLLSDSIAEFRKAIEASDFWLELNNKEQSDWVKELLSRLNIDKDSKVAVCILDTGVNNGHALLSPILADADCHAIDSSWGTDDHSSHGHGTSMAGIAAYGDLRQCLQTARPILLLHCLESVKILPPPPKHNKKELWGYVTQQAVYRVEIQAPERKRIICMAVAAEETRDKGRPSSWSGELDQIISGTKEREKQLFIVCAGNTHLDKTFEYPASQITNEIHDPAQAWNAISVGAYTDLSEIRNPALAGYTPIAPIGDLSPFTTTSLTWEDAWPVKPEIVMEGGNLARDNSGRIADCDELSLLTTHSKPLERQFTSFTMTSAAAAQAAWLAAQIKHKYGSMWPETVRALMIHSALWTDAMKRRFIGTETNKKQLYSKMLRACGYGVPSLERALYSASNALTLIAQGELQPFAQRIDAKGKKAGYKTNEMHLYELPWPKDALLQNPNMDVTMRVTLSYFIEPGPGKIGWKDRYRYASHGLRFDVKSPTEDSTEIFLKRINKASRDADEGRPEEASSGDKFWTIGKTGRQKGSIHSDIWTGTAAELAACGVIAVYPITGWWKERAYLNRWNQKCRYSLIVSISTPEQNIDIYTPVAAQIGIATPIEITI